MITIERVLGAFAIMIVVVFVSWAAYALYSTSTSNGKVDYCFIGRGFGVYEVIGHRPWRSDVVIGSATTPEEANVLLKNSVVCPH